MKSIVERLFELKDEEYAAFSSGLTPTEEKYEIIGVRVPLIRDMAKQLYKENRYEEFLKQLPHHYHEENILHIMILNEMKDCDRLLKYLEQFCPYINNWAVCDSIKPKVLARNKDKLLERIKVWIKDDHEYTCRLAIEMLMTYYLDNDYKPEYSKMVAGVKRNEYYVEMMQAWYFATALAKQWDDNIIYLKEDLLSFSVFRKTVQKCMDSYRISDERKIYLKELRENRKKKEAEIQ